MPEPVRVRDNVTGHEYSTYGVYEGMTVLDEPAVDAHDAMLPAKHAEKPPAEQPAKPAASPTTPQARKATTEEH
jgi:hypothetical protein